MISVPVRELLIPQQLGLNYANRTVSTERIGIKYIKVGYPKSQSIRTHQLRYNATISNYELVNTRHVHT